MRQIASAPETVDAELERFAERVTAVIVERGAAGVHGIILADDIPYQQSTYISPTFVERHLLPVWRRQMHFDRELGVPIFFHSDSNLKPVILYIAVASFDGLQCMEPSAGMDLARVKKIGRRPLSDGEYLSRTARSVSGIRMNPCAGRSKAGWVPPQAAGSFSGPAAGSMEGCRPPGVDHMCRLVYVNLCLFPLLDASRAGLEALFGLIRTFSPVFGFLPM